MPHFCVRAPVKPGWPAVAPALCVKAEPPAAPAAGVEAAVPLPADRENPPLAGGAKENPPVAAGVGVVFAAEDPKPLIENPEVVVVGAAAAE